MSSVFEQLIEPDLDSVPVLEVVHSEWRDSVKFRVTQTISRNVFTDFDRKLSRHLAATRGEGFPAFKVTVEIVDLRNSGKPRHLTPSYHDSAPHALTGVAERAFTRVGEVELVLQRGDCNPGQVLPVSHRRKIDGDCIAVLKAGLDICNHLGSTEFLHLSGEFDQISIAPPGGVEPVVVRIQNGTVLVPCTLGPTRAPFDWPISSFPEHASTNVSAQNYLGSVRQAIVAEKEAAILDFRAAAEQRILAFDQALAGRVPEGHWRESAKGLIARLQAGLGDTFKGLSEAARGKALDWCDDAERVDHMDLGGAMQLPANAGRADTLRAIR